VRPHPLAKTKMMAAKTTAKRRVPNLISRALTYLANFRVRLVKERDCFQTSSWVKAWAQRAALNRTPVNERSKLPLDFRFKRL
jgi:hypothetical protein